MCLSFFDRRHAVEKRHIYCSKNHDFCTKNVDTVKSAPSSALYQKKITPSDALRIKVYYHNANNVL